MIKYKPEVFTKDLGEGKTLVIHKGIAFKVLSDPIKSDFHLVLMSSPNPQNDIALGIAESFELAVEYVTTLDKEKLLAAA